MILDTNALSAWADGDPACRSALLSAACLVVPVVVLGEFTFGIRQSRHRRRYEAWLKDSLEHAELAPMVASTAATYADLRLVLKAQGTPIPSNDLWIAALAVERRLPLLSRDAHFDRVPGLTRVAF